MSEFKHRANVIISFWTMLGRKLIQKYTQKQIHMLNNKISLSLSLSLSRDETAKVSCQEIRNQIKSDWRLNNWLRWYINDHRVSEPMGC